MKKCIKFLLLVSLSALLAAGCHKQEETEEIKKEEVQQSQDSSVKREEGQTESVKDSEQEPEKTESGQGETETTDTGADRAETVLLYLPNENVDGFVTEEAEVEELTPEALLEQLSERGLFDSQVQSLFLERVQDDGEDALDLDMNQAFATRLEEMGTAGEYALLGSICNTFLEAYHCQKIRITVEGGTLATGHNEYPGYMRMFTY